MCATALKRAALMSLLGLVCAVPLAAQSAQDIVRTALEKYESRISGIDNYTLVQDVMGMEVTTYFEKQVVDGHPTFVLRSAGDQASAEEDVGEYYAAFLKAADHSQLEGEEAVDGRACYVVRIDDLDMLDVKPQAGGEEEDFTAKTGRFYIDKDDYLIRKMVIEGEARADGETRPVSMEMELRDYRDVDGLLYPFESVMQMSGAGTGMSEEDLAEARKSLQEMRAQMAEMSAAERKMMEKMMKGQMERLEKMVESGSMKITIEVKELRVNAGPPEK